MSNGVTTKPLIGILWRLNTKLSVRKSAYEMLAIGNNNNNYYFTVNKSPTTQN